MPLLFLLTKIFAFSCVYAAEDKTPKSIEDFLQSLSTIPSVMDKSDPFIQAPAPFEPETNTNEVSGEGISLLERYPASSYSVIAILIGDNYPRALVKAPGGDNSIMIVKENDKLGQGGLIKRIFAEGIVVAQKQRSGFSSASEITLRMDKKKKK